jgi:hypothetical protein
MSQIPLSEPWEMQCANINCELYLIIFPVYNSDTVECGGCNTVYEKPE